MLFLKAVVIGIGVTLGMEIALGFCFALKHITKENKK